jgi:hypothetical protein
MRKVTYLGLAVLVLGLYSPLQSQEKKKDPESKADVLKKIMVDKLKFSQLMLEGLALADYPKIAHGAEQLTRLSNKAEWFVLKTPRYEMHSNEFRRATELVEKKAKEKSVDGATLAYMEVVMACVRCHQYVREVRDARLPMPPLNLATFTPQASGGDPVVGPAMLRK